MKQWLAAGGVVLLSLITGCTYSLQRRNIQAGEKALAQSHDAEAFRDYEKAVHGPDHDLALEAARRAARLAHFELKKYQVAIDLYRFIVVASTDSQERKTAEENIAQIYFENMLNYERAIVEYERLLQLDYPASEKYLFRLNIAKCQHRLGNLDQALVELDALAQEKLSDNDLYDLLLFKSNVLMSQKKQSDAAAILTDLIKKFPERAKKEDLQLTLALCYEDMGDFKQSVELLEVLKSSGYAHPDFLDAQIARLHSRISNAPGAFGFKK